ncbi:hypothetical protein ZHAS_00013041 [Anopheles sinensis]|uniref:Uncharacterized protein n=1 Tax=Anopheles sinensis TaxID=74873 RepID=A0A084W4H5_ANOSI|nr:hypothetical protein ZHAS_00013041 [Anopheles sinensis]
MDVIVSASAGAATAVPPPPPPSGPAPTAAVVAAAIASRSLRVRTSSQSGKQPGEVLSEIQLCPSVMSEGTRKMLPPTTETIQTKPFPIRGRIFVAMAAALPFRSGF